MTQMILEKIKKLNAKRIQLFLVFFVYSIPSSHVFRQALADHDRMGDILQLVFGTDARCEVFKQDIQRVIALMIGLLADRGEDGAAFQQFERCRDFVKRDNAWMQSGFCDCLAATVDAACCEKECIGLWMRGEQFFRHGVALDLVIMVFSDADDIDMCVRVGKRRLQPTDTFGMAEHTV